MNYEEIRGLQEAYNQVYAPQEVENVAEDSRRTSNKQHTARVRANIKSFGSNYTPPSNYDPDANRGKGEVVTRKQIEKKRRKALRQEEVENVEELYKGKHGQSDKEYADSRSQGGKMVSGDSKQSGAEYTHGRRVKAANPGMQPDVGGKTKPKSQGKMDRGTRADIEYRKANLKKEELELDQMIESLVERGHTEQEAYALVAQFTLDEAEKPFPHEKVKAKQVALRGKGGNALDRRMKMGMAVRRAKEAEKTGGSQRDAGKDWYHAKEDYVNEAQAARNNPEKYEREQSKKSAPVRGERTPMPPRGDKRREDFEKWYAKQMGR